MLTFPFLLEMRFIASILLLILHLQIAAQRVLPIVVDRGVTKKSVQKTPYSFLASGGTILYKQDFEKPGSGFPYENINDTSLGIDDGYYIGTSLESNSGQVWKVPAHGRFAYTNDDKCNCDKSKDVLTFPIQSLSGQSNMYLQFDAYFNRVASGEKAFVEYNIGSGYVHLIDIRPNTHWQTFSIALQGSNNKSVQFRIVYDDGMAWASGLAIDNVTICEAQHAIDLALDSLKINGQDAHEFYTHIPIRQAAITKLDVSGQIQNRGKQSTTNSQLVSDWSILDNSHFESTKQNITPMSRLFVPSVKKYALANGKGQYQLTSYTLSDSLDLDKSNDSTTIVLNVSDTTISRINSKKAERAFWYGPNKAYGIAYQIELSAADTATSISIYLDPATQEEATLDVRIYNEFYNKDVVKDTFPQINENIEIKREHIGQWVTFQIPQTSLKPGKYFIGIEAKSKNVLIGVSENPVTKGLVKTKIKSGAGDADYMPFVKLNFKSAKCDSIKISSAITKPGCGFQNGSINVTANGGQSPYSYQWGENANYSTSPNLSGLSAGVYHVTVVDSLGCGLVRKLGISNQGSLSIIKIKHAHEKCFGDSVGEISLSPSGGIPPYSFKWNDGSSDSSINHLTAGDYTVALTDASGNGCTTYGTYTILGPKEMLEMKLIVSKNACFNDSSGGIEIVPYGGFGEYQYKWSDGSIVGRLDTNLKSGWYKITTTDANSCSVFDSAEVKGSPPIVVNGTVIDNVGSGEIHVKATGGVPPVIYRWTGPANSDFKNPGTASIVELRYQGDYKVEVIDKVGCSESKTYTVGGVVSASENESGQKISVFPNPLVGSELTIKSLMNTSFEFSVLNLMGESIIPKQKRTGITRIHLPNPSVYILLITFEDGSNEILKVVKQ